MVKFTSKDKDWITAEIKIEITKINYLYTKAKTSRNPNDFDNFKRQRNHVTDLIRKTKKDHIKNLAHKLTASSEKSWCKLVKKLCGQGQSSSIPAIICENIVVDNAEEKANKFNSFFANICQVDETNITEIPDAILNLNSLDNIEISEQDLIDQLASIQTNKATGPDNISARLLKTLSEVLVKPIQILFKQSMEQDTFPRCWKQANLTPIYKKRERHLMNNYRPVSLLPILGKLLEKMVYKHTFNHVKDFINPNQSGFLPNHSTLSQLLHLYHNILESLDGREEYFILFCDISKAFDRTSHRAIINKLTKLGINGSLLNWYKNYLSLRQQRVVVEGMCSSWRDIKAGIPQGSVLGPLLFLIFMNDLGDEANHDIYLFADDAIHTHASHNLIASQPNIQTDIDEILRWGDKWAVTYNETKTEYMIVSRNIQPSIINLNMRNNPIRQVQIHKHLGLLMNHKATWHDHIKSIINKANRRLGILKKLKYTLD
jgi:hypothetical protein